MQYQHSPSSEFRLSKTASKQKASSTSRHSDSRSVGTGSVISFAEIAKQKLRNARLQKNKELQLKAKQDEEK